MPKVKLHLITKEDKYRVVGNFFEIVSSLNSKREVIDFFVGLLTPSEALMMGRRIQIAQMLLEENSYEDIRKVLKVSNQTITKTEQWLQSGDDVYRRWMWNKLVKKKSNPKEMRRELLDKYAHHRLLKNLLS